MNLLDATQCWLYDLPIMRIFHLADLHLGKSIFEHDLIEDQRHALKAVAGLLAVERPACMIISGDVFDRAVPSADAIDLLGEFVAEIKGIDPGIVLAIIPGNHDSAARLAFMASVLASAGVHIAADADTCDEPVLVERDGERARLWLVPFLTPGAFFSAAEAAASPENAVREVQPDLFDELPVHNRDEQTGQSDQPGILRSQAELFNEAMRRVQQARFRGHKADRDPVSDVKTGGRVYDVLVCHVFARGGQPSESEREFLGNAELVDGTVFNTFDYVALGHLHRPQAAGIKAMYPGSMLAYTFGETGVERGFLSVDVSPGAMTAEFRAIKPLRAMVRVQGRYDEILKDASHESFSTDYVEVLLEDSMAILNPMDALRKRFNNILSLRQAVFERSGTVTTGGGSSASGASSVTDDYRAFHREMFGSEPFAEDSALFAELCVEASREAQ